MKIIIFISGITGRHEKVSENNILIFSED
jgi:uncharacterized protein YkvS